MNRGNEAVGSVCLVGILNRVLQVRWFVNMRQQAALRKLLASSFLLNQTIRTETLSRNLRRFMRESYLSDYNEPQRSL